ncbi:DUF6134 family protein [Flavobacterium cellulosilyticum]|uniref:Uncharacterized protein n=1 Tax=Flavobacterium cellulosilyticum TaxID=2541731 RepID=A0A4R5CAV5_9FLAO|nr:DUF6134 family protein [Flavobacterium cellulosilyticum]TDD95959.1 hypothetical protein E0F76_12680 [Flavobacterium cellulosilyticum]
MKFNIILVLLSVFNMLNANSQTKTLQYKLLVAGENIGTVTATKKIEGNKTTYMSNADASANFIFKTEIKTRMSVVYKNDILQESSFKLFKNGKLKEESTTNLKNGVYTIIHDNETNYYNKNIFNSTIILLFELPNTKESYFEEVEGTFKNVTLINENLFQLLGENSSQKDDYRYRNGILYYSLVRNTFVNFEMVLKANY